MDNDQLISTMLLLGFTGLREDSAPSLDDPVDPVRRIMLRHYPTRCYAFIYFGEPEYSIGQRGRPNLRFYDPQEFLTEVVQHILENTHD